MENMRKLGFLLVCGFTCLATTTIFGMGDQHAIQEKPGVRETSMAKANEQKVLARKKISLNQYEAWFMALCFVADYHLVSSMNHCQDDEAIVNVSKVLLATGLALNIPAICCDEIDADLYFSIEALKGLERYAHALLKLCVYHSGKKESKHFLLLIMALLNFGFGTDRLKKSVHYFMTGEADNLIVAS